MCPWPMKSGQNAMFGSWSRSTSPMCPYVVRAGTPALRVSANRTDVPAVLGTCMKNRLRPHQPVEAWAIRCGSRISWNSSLVIIPSTIALDVAVPVQLVLQAAQLRGRGMPLQDPEVEHLGRGATAGHPSRGGTQRMPHSRTPSRICGRGHRPGAVASCAPSYGAGIYRMAGWAGARAECRPPGTRHDRHAPRQETEVPTIPHTTLTRLEVDALAASPVIVGHRRGGLFDRVICLLNVIRIANVFGAEPRFLWENGAIGDNAHHRYEDGFTAIL